MDIWRAVDAFYKKGCFVRILNSTFIALIPKKKGAEEIKDFKSISLLGSSVYKIFSKLVAERLKKVINSPISPNQNAFIKGRQITDAALVANESLDNLMKRRKKGVACKLDLEKAYGHYNVEESGKFGMVKGAKIGKTDQEGMMLTHNLYADDSLLFCEADKAQMLYLRGVLLCFEAVTGLKVNLAKSSIFSINADECVEDLANITGCRLEKLPTAYLGLPLGVKRTDKNIWQGVILIDVARS
ncbi:PREDICTED: uncharacterized protein LOC109241488 [Nicotiana attenuata]|uniref:uncharacterized protein LOC109241488 n=1 Tax=Nicotiana attenuata TaxID=49451 RepID=UPI0009048399|nr:PREDICTED: uncharacterized protein LOC109241488 [Nicotiana attenuata]